MSKCHELTRESTPEAPVDSAMKRQGYKDLVSFAQEQLHLVLPIPAVPGTENAGQMSVLQGKFSNTDMAFLHRR